MNLFPKTVLTNSFLPMCVFIFFLCFHFHSTTSISKLKKEFVTITIPKNKWSPFFNCNVRNPHVSGPGAATPATSPSRGCREEARLVFLTVVCHLGGAAAAAAAAGKRPCSSLQRRFRNLRSCELPRTVRPRRLTMAQQNLSCHYNESMGFFYNNSGANDKWDQAQLILMQVVGSFFCCFILLSNAMVIAAVITNKRFHYPFYYLLANLAASDFLAGIAYVYLMFNTGEVSRTLTVKGYLFRQGLLDVSLSASLSNLLVIALERYISIMNWKVHSNLTKRRVTLLIVMVWAISIFMGAVPSLGWNCICNLSDCSQLAPVFSRSYLIFWSVSNLVVFLVMVVIYMRIYTYVKRKTSESRVEEHLFLFCRRAREYNINQKNGWLVPPYYLPNKNGIKSRRSQSLHSLPASACLTVNPHVKLREEAGNFGCTFEGELFTHATVLGSAFVFCWTPGLVVLLMDGLNCRTCNVMKLKRWLLLLAVLNSVMNPCIYSYKDEEMWTTFKNLMRCIRSGTRRQRSMRANIRPHSSGQDTGNSQFPSEETKEEEKDNLHT
ncbi:hypothetical protein fugu_006199 [Takifugu bimaculatus]|uniref:G-protein coupled receptors family 1 profile domain-containing protein n=1 Tax=Takifugu bimaculatus TaxID=433685 RepID=A0A4Z2B8S1_9TELE|nr:hypothetical protein fugu_006199 [Takifugu bimaculatus]